LGTLASRRQGPEKYGHYVRNPVKPEGFAITSNYYKFRDIHEDIPESWVFMLKVKP